MQVTRHKARSLACFLGFLIAARPAAAETLSLIWDPNPDGAVAGYMVYVGTQPGTPSNAYDAGRTTSFEWNGAIDGQQYYFSVASYSAGPILGLRSPEVSRYPNIAPMLNNPGPQTGVQGTVGWLQLTGSDPEGAALTYGVSGLPPGLQLTPTTGQISGSPSITGSYTVTATVSDGVLSAAQTFVWSVLQEGSDTGGTTSTTPTTQPIHGGTTTTQPTHGGTTTQRTNLAPTLVDPGSQTSTSGTPVTLQLIGSDPEGSVLTYGASGLPPGLQLAAATGRISGSVSRAGRYTVTATVTDGGLSDAKTFIFTAFEPATDTIAPVISVTLPTTSTTFTIEDLFVTLGGTVTDNGDVMSVSWSSDRGGQGSTTGTDNWIAGVPVFPGSNVITVTARDQAGNVGTRSIRLTVSLKGQRTPSTVRRAVTD